MTDREVAQIWTFPTDISQFDDDERISYSRLDRKYIAVQDDGTEFEFDQSLKRWIPLADNDDEGDDNAPNDPAAYAAAQQRAGNVSESRKRKPDHSYYNSEVSCTRCCRCRRLCAAVSAPPRPLSSSFVFT